MDKSRKLSFDILRILAAYSVVMLHTSAKYISFLPVSSFDFSAANFYDSINRFGVPIFVMLSGALFLNPQKETELKRLWLHNILRIFVVFIIWNYAYYVYQSIYIAKFDFAHQGILDTITGITYGSGHLWYLGMIIGLYALSPVIKSWILKATKQNIEYFLFLFIVFNILMTTVDLLIDNSLVSKLTDTFKSAELAGYLGYFVFGYYLVNYEIPKRLRIAIYCTLPIDIAINYLVSEKMTMSSGVYNPGIYDCFGIFTFLEVIAIFMVIVNSFKKTECKTGVSKFINNVSRDTFGIYLIHEMILSVAYQNGLFSVASTVAIWQMPIALCVFVISLLISAVLRRIPYVGRYLC